MREETKEEVEVPRRRRVVLGFSCGRGSRALRARAERAVLGFLRERRISWTVVREERGGIYICRSILASDGGLGGRRLLARVVEFALGTLKKKSR